MRARCPSSQAKSDNEEALRHVWSSACEETHVDFSNTRIETPPSNGRGEDSVRTMKEMRQCLEESVNTLGVTFSVLHPSFALLACHNEWLMNHLVRSDFLVEADERLVKTSPYESHTGNPASRPTDLLNRILVRRREDDDKQSRFQQAWFLGVIAGGCEVITLHPDGTQRNRGEGRERERVHWISCGEHSETAFGADTDQTS